MIDRILDSSIAGTALVILAYVGHAAYQLVVIAQ